MKHVSTRSATKEDGFQLGGQLFPAMQQSAEDRAHIRAIATRLALAPVDRIGIHHDCRLALGGIRCAIIYQPDEKGV